MLTSLFQHQQIAAQLKNGHADAADGVMRAVFQHGRVSASLVVELQRQGADALVLLQDGHGALVGGGYAAAHGVFVQGDFFADGGGGFFACHE